MRIALIFDAERADTWGIYFQRALAQFPVEVTHCWYRDLPRLTGSFDFYFRIDHGSYDFPWPRNRAPAAFIVSETHLAKPFQAIRREAGRYAALFCGHREGALRLARQGFAAHWSPCGCDPALHVAAPQPPRWDFAYVGHDVGLARNIFLQSLRERFPNSYVGTAPHTAMASIYGAARIGVNWGFGDFPGRETFNMRVFEVMAAGALLLTNAVRDESIERLGYRDRRHLVVYRDPREVPSLIEYYLAHESERAAIAGAGQDHTLRHHTYAHRVADILTALTGRAWAVPRQESHAGL